MGEAKPTPYKIRDFNGNNRYGIIASSLKELMEISQIKFDISSPFRAVLESDGTLVHSEEYFRTLAAQTCFIILKEDEKFVSPSNDTSEVSELTKLLKEINLTQTLQYLKEIKTLQKQVDHLTIERGYMIFDEVSCKIIDQGDSSRFKENSPKTTTSKRRIIGLVPTPAISDFVEEEDIRKHKMPTTYEEFDTSLYNSRETRHGIHSFKKRKVMEIKPVYDDLQNSMERCKNKEDTITEELESRSKLQNPNVKCPTFDEIIFMK